MTAIQVRPRAIETIEDAADEPADEARSAAGQARVALAGAIDRLPDLLGTARSGAAQVAERLPDAADRVRAGAQETEITLQKLSDPTLRLLASASIGMAAGLWVAGARRPVTLAAIAAAFILGSAIATRTEPSAP